uniref:Uncharacterized protein n=1 Tax=viral metagenome TaxID=1070528 RepID=A0A6M3JMU5_9ZZZZ
MNKQHTPAIQSVFYHGLPYTIGDVWEWGDTKFVQLVGEFGCCITVPLEDADIVPIPPLLERNAWCQLSPTPIFTQQGTAACGCEEYYHS